VDPMRARPPNMAAPVGLLSRRVFRRWEQVSEIRCNETVEKTDIYLQVIVPNPIRCLRPASPGAVTAGLRICEASLNSRTPVLQALFVTPVPKRSRSLSNKCVGFAIFPVGFAQAARSQFPSIDVGSIIEFSLLYNRTRRNAPTRRGLQTLSPSEIQRWRSPSYPIPLNSVHQ
jgi:hypothetical protein